MEITLDEKDKFSNCVNRQMEQCGDDLNTGIEIESQRVNDMAFYNSDVVNRIRYSADNCTADYTLLRRAVEGWVNEVQILPIDAAACTPKDREAMLQTIGDVNVLRSEALAVSVQYSRESKSTMGNIVAYAKARGDYDREYTAKHMSMIANEIQLYAQRTPFPDLQVQAELDRLRGHIAGLIACTTASPLGRCNFAMDTRVYELMNDYRNGVNGEWKKVSAYWSTALRDLFIKALVFQNNTVIAYNKLPGFYSGE